MSNIITKLIMICISLGLSVFIYLYLWKNYDHVVFWLVMGLQTSNNISNNIAYKKKDHV